MNESMTKITFNVEDEIDKKIRKIQAKRIVETDGWISYSEILTELIENALKEDLFKKKTLHHEIETVLLK